MPKLSLLLVFFLIISNLHANEFNNSACSVANCTAVIDAGSTGTRIHIYSFQLDANNAPYDIKEVWNKKISTTFSSVELKQESVNHFLNVLFTNAPYVSIPVYFYSTAGMRLLSSHKQALYYSYLKEWFKHHSSWTLIEGKTITGKEEGLFGWLSVNYQLNKLKEDKSNAYVGVMDMGGASVQIVFPIDNDINLDPDDVMIININGKKRKLYIHSFLGLGQQVLTYQFLDEKNCFARGYKLPNGNSGNGDAEACQQDVSKLINLVHNVSGKVQPALAKNLSKKWFVLGGLHYLVAKKPFHIGSEEFTSQTLLNQGNIELCTKNWANLVNEVPEQNDLYNFCLLSSYYYSLLVNGYGINPNKRLHQLPSREVDWTLGVIINVT